LSIGVATPKHKLSGGQHDAFARQTIGGGVYEKRLHAPAFAGHQQSRAIPKRPRSVSMTDQPHKPIDIGPNRSALLRPSKSIPAPKTLKTNLLKLTVAFS